MSRRHFLPHHRQRLPRHKGTCLRTLRSESRTIETVISQSRGAAPRRPLPQEAAARGDGRRCTCLSLRINAAGSSRSLSSRPCPDLSLAPSPELLVSRFQPSPRTGRDDTRMLSSPTQRKTLTPENTGLRRRLDRSYAISFHPPSFLAQVRAATFV